jgi:hypothetical protein
MASPRPLRRTFRLGMSIAAVPVASACGLDRFGELDISDAGNAIELPPDISDRHTSPASTSRPSGLDSTAPIQGDERVATSDASVAVDAGATPVSDASVAVDAGSPEVAVQGSDAALDNDSSPGCDFSGTWGSRLVIDVSWVPQGITGVILAPGSGQIKQWTLATRVTSAGQKTTETTVVCGIELPDFSGTQIAGGEKYGVTFPASMFDQGILPTFTVTGTIIGSGLGASYSTAPSAALLGLTLANATTAAWPTSITSDVDSDQDGRPGVTAIVEQGGGYSPVLVDPFGSRADRLYVVIRQVTEITASALDCNVLSGSVTIPKILDASSTAKYAIDSHVIGCRLIGDGGDCAASQTSFVDTTQPVFSPSGSSTFASVRLDSGAACATVRQRLP